MSSHMFPFGVLQTLKKPWGNAAFEEEKQVTLRRLTKVASMIPTTHVSIILRSLCPSRQIEDMHENAWGVPARQCIRRVSLDIEQCAQRAGRHIARPRLSIISCYQRSESRMGMCRCFSKHHSPQPAGHVQRELVRYSEGCAWAAQRPFTPFISPLCQPTETATIIRIPLINIATIISNPLFWYRDPTIQSSIQSRDHNIQSPIYIISRR